VKRATAIVAVVLALVAVRLSRTLVRRDQAPATATSVQSPSYEEGEIVRVDADHQRLVLDSGVGASRREETIAVDPATPIHHGEQTMTIDDVKPGDHVTVRFDPPSRRIAAEVWVAR
jgi:hypothetical protein